MIKIRKYPFVKQEESKDCGASCLQMIIRYYHGYMSMEHIRDLIKINENGTTAYHIVEGAKKIGFEVKGVKCTLDEINEDNIVLPCIANVIINNTYKHFVVIYKIDYIHQTLLVADPSNKIMKMSFDIFKSIFSGILIILYPKDEIPCEENKNLLLEIIYKIIKSHPKLIKQVCILSSFITVFSIISSFFLEVLNNTLIKYQSQSIIILILIIFFSNTLYKNISLFFRQKVLLLINEKINLRLTLETFQKVLSLPYKNYRKKTTGDIVTRILDVTTIKDNITTIFLTLIIDLPLALISSIILYFINSKLFILSTIILILNLLLFWIFKDYFDESILKIKKENVTSTNYMIEAINNYETVKGLDIETDTYRHFEKLFVKLLRDTYNHENILTIQTFLKNLINDIGFILIYGIGSLLVSKGNMTFGNLLSFGALLNYFFEPIKNIVNLENNVRELNLVLKRANDLNIMHRQIGIYDNLYSGNIIFKDLSFSYDDQKIILNKINLEINLGDKVLVMGPSVSGKSTLFKLLMKYYDVDRDKILINNIDINDYINRQGILYVSQNENLFTDSLYNNMVLDNKVGTNKLMEVINICEIDKIIQNDTLGFNLLIEENGFNLSGGEKQRIVLARTLLKKFNILILDEALNQIDIDLERKILKKIFSKFSNKTIIVISHRLDNQDLYNRKLMISNGELIENVSKV